MFVECSCEVRKRSEGFLDLVLELLYIQLSMGRSSGSIIRLMALWANKMCLKSRARESWGDTQCLFRGSTVSNENIPLSNGDLSNDDLAFVTKILTSIPLNTNWKAMEINLYIAFKYKKVVNIFPTLPAYRYSTG